MEASRKFPRRVNILSHIKELTEVAEEGTIWLNISM